VVLDSALGGFVAELVSLARRITRWTGILAWPENSFSPRQAI
jgi:hypothetical protein